MVHGFWAILCIVICFVALSYWIQYIWNTSFPVWKFCVLDFWCIACSVPSGISPQIGYMMEKMLRNEFLRAECEVTGSWKNSVKRVFVSVFCNFTTCHLDDKVKMNEMVRTHGCHGEVTNASKTSAGKPESKGPLGWPWCKLEDTIKIDFSKIGFGGCELDSSCSVQGRVTWSCGHSEISEYYKRRNAS
jgi:hypothetical protein